MIDKAKVLTKKQRIDAVQLLLDTHWVVKLDPALNEKEDRDHYMYGLDEDPERVIRERCGGDASKFPGGADGALKAIAHYKARTR